MRARTLPLANPHPRLKHECVGVFLLSTSSDSSLSSTPNLASNASMWGFSCCRHPLVLTRARTLPLVNPHLRLKRERVGVFLLPTPSLSPSLSFAFPHPRFKRERVGVFSLSTPSLSVTLTLAPNTSAWGFSCCRRPPPFLSPTLPLASTGARGGFLAIDTLPLVIPHPRPKRERMGVFLLLTPSLRLSLALPLADPHPRPKCERVGGFLCRQPHPRPKREGVGFLLAP